MTAVAPIVSQKRVIPGDVKDPQAKNVKTNEGTSKSVQDLDEEELSNWKLIKYPNGTKQCATCKVDKFLSDFGQKPTDDDNYLNNCKACNKHECKRLKSRTTEEIKA